MSEIFTGEMWNLKVVDCPEPRFKLKISDFPGAVQTAEQKTESSKIGDRILQFAIYRHPEFERQTPEGFMDYVAVLDGYIIGPYFILLKPARKLQNMLLEL